MDAKQRVQKMLEQGVIDATQARRLKESLSDDKAVATDSVRPRRHVLLFCGAFGLALLIGMLWVFNSMVVAREAVAKSSADLQSQYQRRYDLIPQVVESVKRFMAHERATLVEVASMRSDPMRALAESVQNLEKASDEAKTVSLDAVGSRLQMRLGGQLREMLLVAEQYPALKSADQFLALQAQIEGAENRINIARLQLNRAVANFNTGIQQIPQRWFAAIVGFHRISHFEAQPGAEHRPQQMW